jgi:hypothetical protein
MILCSTCSKSELFSAYRSCGLLESANLLDFVQLIEGVERRQRVDIEILNLVTDLGEDGVVKLEDAELIAF